MFGRKKIEAQVQVAPVAAAPISRPSARSVETLPLPENELRAYVRIAETVGFEPAALLEARLLAFFAEHDMKHYAYSEVARYLDAEAEKVSRDAGWWWMPLREKDIVTAFTWGKTHREGYEGNLRFCRTGRDYYRSDRWECRPYNLAVPLRVLVSVEKIEQVFGGKLKFFVTQLGIVESYKQKPMSHLDPFIMVTAMDMKNIVFDVWDEPGFSG